MASQAVWLLNDSDSSAAVVVEWISSSAEALYVSGAASRLCSAAAGHLKLLKYQTSLEHCSDVLASWSQTCFMRLSNGIHTCLHKLNLSMRYLASHSVCRCSSLLSRCMIWLAGLRLKSNLFYPSSVSSVIGKVCKCESWGKASCLIIHFVLKTISITAKLGATACCSIMALSISYFQKSAHSQLGNAELETTLCFDDSGCSFAKVSPGICQSVSSRGCATMILRVWVNLGKLY